MSVEVNVFYQNKKFSKEFKETDTIKSIYTSCRSFFSLKPNSSEFIFFTSSQKEIGSEKISNIFQQDEPKSIHIISKSDMSTLNEFLNKQFPSLRYESLIISSSLTNFLVRIHFIHEVFSQMKSEAPSLMLSLLPIDIIEGKKDFILVQALCDWFYHFFQFQSDPVCYACSNQTVFVGSQKPSKTELSNGYQSADKFQCQKCSAITRQLRTKDLFFLIQNPSGKADESASLFALALKSLEIEPRIVINLQTNHTWVEYFSENLKRFIHVDPSENYIDEPLIYESCWKLPHSRVVAIGEYECKDVTPRYSDHPDTDQKNIFAKKNCR